MNTKKLTDELEQYESQLQQVTFAINSSPDGQDKDELLKLRENIEELITLTKASIVKSEENEKNDDCIDSEYERFQREMAELDEEQDNVEHDKTSEEQMDKIQAAINDIEGSKCQAPFKSSWNNTSYHNALVFQVLFNDSVTNINDIQVRVMFTHPSVNEMLPCPYFLDGDCKFSEDKCKFSHGALVSINELREYREPDFSSIKLGSTVLTKNDDQLWYRAKIISIEGEEFLLKLESRRQEVKNNLKDIFPLDNCGESEASDDENDSDECEDDVNEIEKEMIDEKIVLAPSTSALGEWEKHTTGFGSRLMAKMGYTIGSGLGSKGQGRVEPVSIQILPTGKSLDYCMMLRENAGGDENLFKAERKMRRKQRKHESALAKSYEREQNRTDVFTFLNSKLGLELAKPKQHQQKSKNLMKETNRGLNVTSLQLCEEIRRTEKDISSLKQSLNRQNIDTPAYNCIQEKLQNRETDLKELKLTENKITLEQEQRKDRKKLSVF